MCKLPGLIANCAAISAGIGSAEVPAWLFLSTDSLVAAEHACFGIDSVAHLGKFSFDFLTDVLLKTDAAAINHLTAGRRRAFAVHYPRMFAGLLGAHAKVNHVHKYLPVPLWLKVTANNAKRKNRFTFSGYKGRDDSVERTFVRFKFIKMVWVQ